MRAIWTGSLSFGLVNIPVRIYSGSEPGSGLDLTMLHAKDLSPIRYARVCRQDGQEVPYEDIVKGYEYRSGDYVVLSEQDFQKASARKTKAIDIIEFTSEDQIDVRYYEKPYYLEPAKGAEKPYVLLHKALVKSSKVAVASFVMRGRQHLAAIKPVGLALVLNQLRFPSEIRSTSDLSLPHVERTDKKEIDMALALIDHLTLPFIAEDFHDTYTEELEKVIAAKAKGKKPPQGEPAPATTNVKDLMATLKASLERERDKPKVKK
jgi:DNA end-binding protein Ku